MGIESGIADVSLELQYALLLWDAAALGPCGWPGGDARGSRPMCGAGMIPSMAEGVVATRQVRRVVRQHDGCSGGFSSGGGRGGPVGPDLAACGRVPDAVACCCGAPCGALAVARSGASGLSSRAPVSRVG
jgi:hypothetical protein